MSQWLFKTGDHSPSQAIHSWFTGGRPRGLGVRPSARSCSSCSRRLFARCARFCSLVRAIEAGASVSRTKDGVDEADEKVLIVRYQSFLSPIVTVVNAVCAGGCWSPRLWRPRTGAYSVDSTRAWGGCSTMCGDACARWSGERRARWRRMRVGPRFTVSRHSVLACRLPCNRSIDIQHSHRHTLCLNAEVPRSA